MISGRLKKTLKNRCPYCGAILQIRTITVPGIEHGMEISHGEDKILCSGNDCEYEEELEQKRVRRKDYIVEV
jgi:hypothetical protein